MKILVTAPKGVIFDRHFPPDVIGRLENLGEVRFNPYTRQLTRDELKKELADTDIVMTHWGSTQYDAELLDAAPELKILAHCAGTVAHIASEECYRRNIHVLSANSIMARYVAEGVLGMMLAAMREFTYYDSAMKRGEWNRRVDRCKTLIGSKVGFIGLGAVGRDLLDLLLMFDCEAKVYDPYITVDALDRWDFASAATFEEAMSCPVVTVHASQTPETFHIINEKALALIPEEKRGGVNIGMSDAYVNVIGGLQLDEPAADLALVLAAASSFRDKPIDPSTAAIGEVGLTGEIRAVTGLQQRLTEAARTGFKTCIIPRHGTANLTAPDGVELLRVRNIREAIELALA